VAAVFATLKPKLTATGAFPEVLRLRRRLREGSSLRHFSFLTPRRAAAIVKEAFSESTSGLGGAGRARCPPLPQAADTVW